LNKGGVPEGKTDYLIERPGIFKYIASILQPPVRYNSYDISLGNQGIGKTLTQHIGPQHAGIIYINVGTEGSSNYQSMDVFAKALS